MRKRTLWLMATSSLITLCLLGAVRPTFAGRIRVAYLIPSNRTAQPDAVATLRNAIVWWHNWYKDQMDRYGMGPKSFVYETEADGITPRIQVVSVPRTDDYIRADTWNHTIEAAAAAGLWMWSYGMDWLLIAESHIENPSGSIEGGVALGASYGSADDPGIAVLGSNALPVLRPGYSIDDRAYAGMVIPEIGPYPLVQDVSFAWFEGTTLSSLCSTYQGAGLHELSHGLGMPHDFRNDDNFNGNLMGNGLRGFRGPLYPDRYPDNETRLGYGEALALSVSTYFQTESLAASEPAGVRQCANPASPRAMPVPTTAGAPWARTGVVYGESEQPQPPPRPRDGSAPAAALSLSLSILTSGSVAPQNGLLPVQFTAADPNGLAAALLFNGDLVDEMPLTGTTVNATFRTPYYTPGQANAVRVAVYNTLGDRLEASSSITPLTGYNRAPQPFFKVAPSTAGPGQSVLLDASRTTDPNHSASALKVEWDLNGDGVFDTTPTTVKTLTTTFPTIGARLIRVRVTDPAGAQSVSTPIALRIADPVSYSVQTAKNKPNNSLADIRNAVVSAAFDGFFYLEADDRSSGIRVQLPNHGLQIGMRANAAGPIKTNENGERYIEAYAAFRNW